MASEWQTFINNINQLGPAIILLIGAMLIIGYSTSNWLKMTKKQSLTVAIESGIQNGTVGITIGNLIINPETGLSILSIPSGVYGILMYFVCLPFVFWYIQNGYDLIPIFKIFKNKHKFFYSYDGMLQIYKYFFYK